MNHLFGCVVYVASICLTNAYKHHSGVHIPRKVSDLYLFSTLIQTRRWPCICWTVFHTNQWLYFWPNVVIWLCEWFMFAMRLPSERKTMHVAVSVGWGWNTTVIYIYRVSIYIHVRINIYMNVYIYIYINTSNIYWLIIVRLLRFAMRLARCCYMCF